MKIGRVIGNVWATKKDDALEGLKLLIIESYDPKNDSYGQTIVAADTVGAGTGELVLYVGGSSARVTFGKNVPIDATIVGIIDEVEIY